jgi:Spy/CpxP family protein refolding chaperone
MSTKGVRVVLAVGALALTLAAVVPLLAHGDQGPPPIGGEVRGPGPGGRGPMGRGPGGPMGLLGDIGPAIRQAGLSSEQQEQIKNVMDSHRDEFKALGERMRAAHQGMRAAVEADTVDENTIRAKSQEVAGVEADQAILGAKVRAEILTLLTPEQVEKIKQFRAEMQKRMEQRGARRRVPGR